LIRFTPNFVTNDENADFEIHSLLGKRHVGMCLWSIKSLLHFSGKRYSVVLHDDGSLTDRDIHKLEQHLVNVRVIRKPFADNQIVSKINTYPNVLKYRFGDLGQTEWGKRMSIFSLKLLDFNVLANASKILVLDTDVLFFKKPDEIIRWAEDPASKECLYAYEEYVPIRDAANTIVGFEKKTDPQCFFNSGLICFDKSAFNLSVLNDWLGNNKERVDKVYIFEQQTYNHLVHQTLNHGPLPSSYSFNYNDPMCVATHFGIKLLFFKNLKRIRRAIVPCQSTRPLKSAMALDQTKR
jgi:lipopolysaccharide biosynthesis glycosyltransferase